MPKHFWITNISNKDISLEDLGLTIKAHRSINLLDRRHYSLNTAQLTASAATGSLFKKRDKVVVRKIPPPIERRKLLEVDREAVIPTRRRSTNKVEEVYYEELDISDDTFAEQAADLVDENIKNGSK